LYKAGKMPAIRTAGLPLPLVAAFFQKASLRVQPAKYQQQTEVCITLNPDLRPFRALKKPTPIKGSAFE
jgi:hypothetical protein